MSTSAEFHAFYVESWAHRLIGSAISSIMLIISPARHFFL